MNGIKKIGWFSLLDIPFVAGLLYLLYGQILFTLDQDDYNPVFFTFVGGCFFTVMYIFEQYHLQRRTITFFISGVLAFILFEVLVFGYLFVFLNVQLKKPFFDWFYAFFTGIAIIFSLYRWLFFRFIISRTVDKNRLLMGFVCAEMPDDIDFEKLKEETKALGQMEALTRQRLINQKDVADFNLLILDDDLCDAHQEWAFQTMTEQRSAVMLFSDFCQTYLQKMPIKKQLYGLNLLKINAKSDIARRLHLIFCQLVNYVFVLLLSPVLLVAMPIISILNLFFNKGILFYTQKRVGLDGKEFLIYKFRTMVANAEQGGVQMAQKNDARITPLGRVLRMLRIDEVPQILAILKGDMNFIGPRPERLHYVEQLIKKHPAYRLRHLIKPGLTGWAQVNFRYGENMEDSITKLSYDLYYLKHKNVLLDIQILLKTVSAVLFTRGV